MSDKKKPNRRDFIFTATAAVGAVGVPVRAGDAKGALRSSASCRPSTLLMTWL